MNIIFPKDLLIIDFESTLGDTEKTEPTQFGAILLDKSTLEEKKSFVSFIQTDLSIMPKEKLIKKGFTPEKFANAPSTSEVVKKFIKEFGKDYFITSWVAGLDMILFRKLLSSAKVNFSEFDYHVYDLWPIAFSYLLEKGYKGSWRSEAIFQEFGLPPRNIHDALEDCRHAAKVLRKMMEKKEPPN